MSLIGFKTRVLSLPPLMTLSLGSVGITGGFLARRTFGPPAPITSSIETAPQSSDDSPRRRTQGNATSEQAVHSVDIASLTSLCGSSLLVKLLSVLPHFSADQFRQFADSWVVLIKTGAYYDIEDANWNLIVRYWAGKDPRGLEIWLQNQFTKNLPAGSEAVTTAVLGYLKQCPAAVLAWCTASQIPALIEILSDSPAISAVTKRKHSIPLSPKEFEEEALRDPASMVSELAMYKTQTGWGFSWDPYSALALAWAGKDPMAALAWAEGLSEKNQAEAISAIAKFLSTDELLALRQRRPATEQHSLGWDAVLKVLEVDHWAALRLTAQLFKGKARQEIARIVLQRIAKSDPERAVPIFRELGWPNGANAFLEELAKTDPAKAFAEVAHMSGDQLTHPLFYSLVNWATTDFDTALAWARNAPLALRGDAIRAVAATLPSRGLEEAREFARNEPPGMVREQTYESLVAHVMHKDQAMAIAEIAAAPDDMRTKLAALFYMDIEHDPQGILLNILKQASATPELNNRYLQIATHAEMSRVQPLLTGLPEESVPPEAWRIATERWSRQDPVAASAWTRDLPQGVSRDHAVAGLIQGILAEGDAPAAWQWATSVRNAEVRIQLQKNILTTWERIDPAAAEAATTEQQNSPP